MGVQINGDTGNVIATKGTFSGDVGIGGTLTYEDVTNVDAVGLITARSGILLDDSITHLGDTNTKIRFPATDTFSVETAGSERLRITSGGQLELSKDQNDVTGRPDNRIVFKDTDSSVAANQPIGEISWYSSDAGMANINAYIRGINEATNGSGALTFGVKAAGSSEIESLRIESNGRIAVGGFSGASNDLHIKTASSPTIRLEDTTNTCVLLSYAQNTNAHVGTYSDHALMFDTNSIERFRIDNSGRLVVGGSSAGPYHGDGDNLNIYSTGNTGLTVFSGTSSLGSLFFADGNDDVHSQRRGAVQYNHSDNSLAFWTNASQRLSINSSGYVSIGTNDDTLAQLELRYTTVPAYLTNSYDGTVGEATLSVNVPRTSAGSGSWGSHSNTGYGSAAIQALSHSSSGGYVSILTGNADNTNPTERFRITSTGNLGWKGTSVLQRKTGGFKGISGATTEDTRICADFGNNDLLRVRWAINWNSGDGGAWGEAVIWKQYEGTVRVRYVSDVKASPITSVSFPNSGTDVWLRITTSAGINGYYMFDVEASGCTPDAF